MDNNERNDLRITVYNLREEKGHSWSYIGDLLGFSRKKARTLYDEYEEEQWLLENETLTEALEGSYKGIRTKVGPSKAPQVESNDINITRFQPMHIHGDATVTCDWHVPLHSTRMVNSLLEKAYAFGSKKLIIAGDLLNMDTFSHYQPHQVEARFELEREEVTKLLRACLEVFDEVDMCWGNHDFRIAKFLDFKLSYEYCIRWVLSELGEDLLSRIKISELDHLIYHPGYEDIRLCHQSNFSKIPLTVPRQLVPKYNMSVLAAHSHHFAQGVALDGKNRIYEGGGLFSPERTQYIRRTSTHHNWVQGYYIWKDGLCNPFSPIYHNI